MARRRDIGTDDHRVKVRPSRSKPRRSKKTVDYSDAPTAFVTSIDRGRYHVLLDGVHIMAVKARELGRHSIVVGDKVGLNGDISGKKDTLARIVSILPRQTVLMRSVEDTAGMKEKPIVANANQLAIVSACADPTPRIGMIDRCIVAAYAAKMKPILILTKSDLTNPQEILDMYQPLGVECIFVSALSGDGKQQVEQAFKGNSTVLIGHSGVGKSSLINMLIPGAQRLVGHVNSVTGRGRHTSTSLMAFAYEGGWLIDTPGVRSFGIAHVTEQEILQAFNDLLEASLDCPKLCAHMEDSPKCAIEKLAQVDETAKVRLDSLRRLLRSKA